MLTLLLVGLMFFMLITAQCIWYYGQLMLFERQIDSRWHESECLELEIMREQLTCATHNPEAARILMEKERMRSLAISHPDYHHYRRLWAAHLGGEPVACEAITQEEDASCDIAE